MFSQEQPRQVFNGNAAYRPAVLRALHFAQGQTVSAHKRSTLFLTAIALELVYEEAMTGYLIEDHCPQAAALLPGLLPYLAPETKELETAPENVIQKDLSDAGPALLEMIAFCAARADNRGDISGIFRKGLNISSSAAAYLAMTQDIAAAKQYGGAGDRGKIRRIARLDPFITARFTAEILNFALFVTEATEHEQPLLNARNRLLLALDESAASMARASGEDTACVMQVLTDTSAVLTSAYKDPNAFDDVMKPYAEILKHLAAVTASYDWQQFEHEQAARESSAPVRMRQPTPEESHSDPSFRF